MSPFCHQLESLVGLGHCLGNDDVTRGLFDFARTAQNGGDIAQPEAASHLTLEMVSFEPCVDEDDFEMGIQNRNREARKTSTATEIHKAA